jgi:hypothetical protein
LIVNSSDGAGEAAVCAWPAPQGRSRRRDNQIVFRMGGYRISSFIWRKAILIVTGINRKKPKGF